MLTPLADHADYHVTNARGLTVRTFDTETAAREWVDRNLRDYGVLSVERITVTVTREPVYEPMPSPASRNWAISQGAMA